MVIRKALVALACAGLVCGSTAAAAAPAVVDDVRLSSSVDEAEDLKGVGTFGVILFILIIAGVIFVIAGESEELAVSP